MSWLANLLGSNDITGAIRGVGRLAAGAAVGGMKDTPNLVNSGIGVPIRQKPEEERAEIGGGMKLQKIAAVGAAKAKPNDAIARQFGM